jgi:transcriptional regulator with XRE-family HTH domain
LRDARGGCILPSVKKRLLDDEALLRFTGGELGAFRRERGLSQEELAELAGMSPNSVGVIERGHRVFQVLAISSLYLVLESAGIIVDKGGFVPVRDRPEGARMRAEASPLRSPSIVSLMGAAVRTARKAEGLSLAALAASAQMHPNSLFNFEKGLVVPGICPYYRLLRSLGMDRVTVESGALKFHNK